MEKSTAKAALGYNPINDRIITLKIIAHPVNIMFVQVYGSTTAVAEEEVNRFYEMVEKDRYFKVIMGDWNARLAEMVPLNRAVT